MRAGSVSKRIYITLPDSVYDDLEYWAERQGRPTANLASFLVELGIIRSKEEGNFPERKSKDK